MLKLKSIRRINEHQLKPMTRGEWLEFKGWGAAETEDLSEKGYYVIYEQGSTYQEDRWITEAAYKDVYVPLRSTDLWVTETAQP